MRNLLVAGRYSKAVVELIDKKESNEFLKECRYLYNLFGESEQFHRYISAEVVKVADKKKIIEELTKELKFKNIWTSLFNLLAEKQRLGILTEILEEIDKELLARKNCLKVELELCSEKSDKVLKNIKALLRKILKTDVEVNIKYNPELIGGFVAGTESLIVDGSIRNNLVKFVSVFNRNQ